MRCISCTIFFVVGLTISTQGIFADNAPIAKEYTVDLSRSDNIKAFFDAGLRPWRVPGLENSICMFENENLHFILPDNVSFRIQAEMVAISVLEGGRLYRIDLTCPVKPIRDAGAELEGICDALSFSKSGLDDFIALKNGRSWGGGKNIGAIYDQVMIESMPSLNGPAADVSMIIEWENIPVDKILPSENPIQPPPGYEGVSMNPPPRDPNQRQNPIHNAEYYQNGLKMLLNGNQSLNAGTANASVANAIASQVSAKPPSTTTSENAASPQSSWLTPKIGLWAIALIVAAMLAIYALKRK